MRTKQRPTTSTGSPSHELRIIGGQWKRSKIKVIDKPGLRPTPDRVRETLFNWLGQDLTGWRCVDAFAGTGALGFEAASRGAQSVLMLEHDAQLVSLLVETQKRLSASAVQVQKGDALMALQRIAPSSLDVVFLDPPFEAAFFEYKGKLIYAFPFQQDTISGKIDYFDEEGKALKNFFLKAPLKFVNITSRYTKNRFHPVQQIWKAHNGTDYAAPTGTPIMTTAAGTVEQTGYTAGNGNFVKVRHDRTYSTQYLHMSKILVRRGQFVNQGDVIGRVGSTGLATGPHVCYRFWKNGAQVDALKLKLPNSEPMNAKFKPRYFNEISPLKKELDNAAKLKFGLLNSK